MAKKFFVPPVDETRCTHYDLCDGPRSAGCAISAMAGCTYALEIKELATKQVCPAFPKVHCDLPDYRVMIQNDAPCGQLGKCFVAEALKGAIPPQDFVSTGKIPENYKRARFKKENVLRVLAECSM